MASAQFTTVKFLRDKNGTDLREALNLFNKLMVDPAIDMKAYELYTTTVDDNFNEVVECVFQASDLKWDACQKIAGALQEKGFIRI